MLSSNWPIVSADLVYSHVEVVQQRQVLTAMVMVMVTLFLFGKYKYIFQVNPNRCSVYSKGCRKISTEDRKRVGK